MALLGSFLGGAALQAVEVGATREQVTAAYGEPAGVVHQGHKEVLNYSDRVVVMENGRVAANTPRSSKESYITTIPAKPIEWLEDLGAASAKAEKEKKQILVLFWGESKEPWVAAFQRGFVTNHAFLRRLQSEYVFLRLPVGKEPPANAGMNEVNAHKKAEELRARAIGDSPVPALAVVSADTRKARMVPLTGIEKATDRIEFFTSRALEKSKSSPMSVASIPGKILIIAGGMAVAGVLLFRKRT
jgi:hypothetical protein